MEPDHLTTPRLEQWVARTRTPLDLLALFTIWLTILPFTSVTNTEGLTWWVMGRLLLSGVYAVDIIVRARLSARPRAYVASHPLALAAVLIPTLRILFSLRLLNSMFRKGNLGHFLFVALVLILNGVVMVFAFEENAPGANIHTLGQSLWWAAVTVATVGYGDLYPVTVGGRLTAIGLMAVGLVSAAVVTAQIASTFMDQASARRAALAADPGRRQPGAGRAARPAPAVAPSEPVPAPADASLHERLDRIEQLLATRLAPLEADAGTRLGRDPGPGADPRTGAEPPAP